MKFLVATPSAEMTTGYTDTLSFQVFFDIQGKAFILRNFLCLSSGKVMGHGNCRIYYKCCFTVYESALHHVCWNPVFYVMTDQLEYKIMTADSNTFCPVSTAQRSISIKQLIFLGSLLVNCLWQLVVSPEICGLRQWWASIYYLFTYSPTSSHFLHLSIISNPKHYYYYYYYSLGSTQPLKMSTRIFLGVKAAGA